MNSHGPRAQRIHAALTELRPTHLEIIDESHLHAGHRPVEERESHFRVMVVSEAFAGASRLQRQRRIHELLAGEFQQGLHALSIRALTPAEYAAVKSS